MKYLKFIFSGTIILSLIIGLFIPSFSINNSFLNVVLLVFSNNFNVYSLILFVAFLLGICSAISLIFEQKSNIFIYVSFILSIVAGLIIMLAKDVVVGGLSDTDTITMAPTCYIVGSLLFVFALFASSYIFKANRFSIRDLVEMAMLIGLAILLDLSFFKIKMGANGGSISFVMVPLMILSLRQGVVKGFIGCGIIFGLTTCLLDGYGFFTFPFDYLLGFGAIAVIGIFNKLILPNDSTKITFKGVLFLTISIIVACFLRLLSSTLSGMVFYGLNFVDSFIYQCAYIPLSAVCSLALMLLLYKPLLLINRIFPTSNFN